MKDILQIHLGARPVPEVGGDGGQDLRKHHFGQALEVPVQEVYAHLALDGPIVSIRIDNAVAKKIPRARLDEVALGEITLLLEDVLEVFGAVDQNARRQGRHGQGQCFVAIENFTLDKPIKQLLSGLQEQDAIAHERQGVGRFPGSRDQGLHLMHVMLSWCHGARSGSSLTSRVCRAD